MGVLTTGFNAPAVDLIAMLRPTKSTNLYVQMAGRGTRLAPGKENCLVLDFAGNVARHGPIDLVKPKDKVKSEADGEAPTKVCPECQAINTLSARVCIDCGSEFAPPEAAKLEATATTRPILSTGQPVWVDVGTVSYHRHEKPGKPPSLRVDYHCGLVRHHEWVCLEHGGYAGSKATQWWSRRAGGDRPPVTVDDALRRAAQLRQPLQIALRPNGRFTEVVNARFA
jgi:DNA repair protein RadD